MGCNCGKSFSKPVIPARSAGPAPAAPAQPPGVVSSGFAQPLGSQLIPKARPASRTTI